MNADDNRTALGRMILFGDCVRYATTRLRINDLLERHPEWLVVETDLADAFQRAPRADMLAYDCSSCVSIADDCSTGSKL